MNHKKKIKLSAVLPNRRNVLRKTKSDMRAVALLKELNMTEFSPSVIRKTNLLFTSAGRVVEGVIWWGQFLRQTGI